MTELGLEARAEVPVEKLSGGQRKRTSVTIELLTRPSLLNLDEPTSGLDPGYEKSVMQLLHDLATSGREIVKERPILTRNAPSASPRPRTS